MFVASYRNTMATAKTKVQTEDGWVTRSIDEMRREKAEERRAAQIRAEEQERLERELFEEARRAAMERLAIETELQQTGRFRHSYQEIERRACKLFRVTRREIRGNRRQHDIVFARQFCHYWSARLTKLSLPQIGRANGGKDHTTILHGKRSYRAKRAKMGRFLREVR